MPTVLGGGEKCPRCDKTVYFAEERRALGRKYHSACLKCSDCQKTLESSNCNEHEAELYCNTCYRKKYGPQGTQTITQGEGARSSSGEPHSVAGNLGGGEQCPRCNRTVYMAEKVMGAGRGYHKSCFKCQACSKALDSTIFCQHEEEIYCKGCYARLFGPKGYGYAGGASGLSMDTGKLDEISTQNVSYLAQAQVPALVTNGGDMGNQEVCARCQAVVYFAERIAGMGKVYHKACFKCSTCNRSLDSTLVTEHEETIYCKSCYGKNFGPKGFGFGTSMVTTSPM